MQIFFIYLAHLLMVLHFLASSVHVCKMVSWFMDHNMHCRLCPFDDSLLISYSNLAIDATLLSAQQTIRVCFANISIVLDFFFNKSKAHLYWGSRRLSKFLFQQFMFQSLLRVIWTQNNRFFIPFSRVLTLKFFFFLIVV